MIIFFMLGLILGGVAVVFALQNVDIITVTFFGWHLTGSLALVLLLAMLMGIIITLFILLPESIGKHFKYKRLQKENARLTEDLRKQKELTVLEKTTPITDETSSDIENGATTH